MNIDDRKNINCLTLRYNSIALMNKLNWNACYDS